MAQGEMHASLEKKKKQNKTQNSETFPFVLDLSSFNNMKSEHMYINTTPYKPGDVSSIFLVKFSDWAWCRLLEDFNCNV